MVGFNIKNPQVKQIKSSNLDTMIVNKASLKMLTETNEKCEEFVSIRRKEGVLTEPYFCMDCTYNYDKMGSDPFQSRSRIVGFLSDNQLFLVISGDKFLIHMTVGIISCANGKLMKRIISHSSPGIQNLALKLVYCEHLDYINDSVLLTTGQGKDELPVLLTLDSLASRWNTDTLEMLQQNNVHI